MATTRSAIAIINTFSGTGQTYSAIASNVIIQNNKCNDFQNLAITSASNVPGLFTSNFNVINNSFGFIYYLTDSSSKINPNINGVYNSGLNITNNNCFGIVGPVSSNGLYSSACVSDIIISSNHCSYIRSYISNGTLSYGSLKINDNSLKALDYSLFTIDAAIGFDAVAIYVSGSGSGIIEANISGNTISGNDYVVQSYSSGIICYSGANIIGNIINNFDTYGIMLNGSGKTYIVNNNQIYRGSEVILGYIYGDPGSICDISGNYFDSTTLNGTDGYAISIPINANWIVERNKNQIVTCIIGAEQGIITLNGIAIGSGSTTTPNSLDTIVGDIKITKLLKKNPYIDTVSMYLETDGWADRTFAWAVSLKDLLPKGVKILNASITVNLTNNSAGGSIYLSLIRNNQNNTEYTSLTSSPIDSASYTTGTNKTLSLNTSSGNFYNHYSDAFNALEVYTGLPSGYASGSIYFSSFIVQYTW